MLTMSPPKERGMSLGVMLVLGVVLAVVLAGALILAFDSPDDPNAPGTSTPDPSGQIDDGTVDEINGWTASDYRDYFHWSESGGETTLTVTYGGAPGEWGADCSQVPEAAPHSTVAGFSETLPCPSDDVVILITDGSDKLVVEG